MDTRTQTVADLVLKNHHNLRKEMAWEAGSNNCAILAAMIGAAYGREITAEQYRACKAILKKNASLITLVAQASPEHTALAANINSTLIMTLIETLIITMIIAASAAASSAASSSH